MTFLVLERLSKKFGEQIAVDRLSLAVGKGEFVSLLGPSGCGKTTTLQMIAGFHPRRPGHHARRPRSDDRLKPAQRGLGNVSSELRAVSAHDGGRERRVRPRDAGRRQS
jgi:putative spermidine/putrescine transport system ATP-binding protein